MGCTEPVAIALAVAKAKSLLKGDVEQIELFLSPNIVKNAAGVGIPGTGLVGIEIAAALGAVGGNPDKLLEVLADINPAHINAAKELVSREKIKTALKKVDEKLYIEVICYAGGHKAKAVIEQRHEIFSLLSVDDVVIFRRQGQESSLDSPDNLYNMLNINSIVEFAATADFTEIAFILEGARMNKKAAEEGLAREYGLQVGRTVQKNIDKRLLSDDITSHAVKLAAAASDARMAGFMMPVMANSGSGNQGITAILPVVAAAERLQANDEQLARALIISNLIAIYIKSKLGRLSALCGAIAAATGASGGITFLLGGDVTKVIAAIKNMIGNVSGMFCDGAKTGCAMKVATVVDAAVRSAILAMDGFQISSYDGIIEDDIDKCIKNLAILGSTGMEETDRLILDIMLRKKSE